MGRSVLGGRVWRAVFWVVECGEQCSRWQSVERGVLGGRVWSMVF